MPAPAAAIASQVRSAIRWPMKMRAATAVMNGPSASVISTLATVVSVRATMNAVNITLQQTPDIQSAMPPARIFENTARPLKSGRMTSSDSAVKKLRQKVTSKLLAASSWRVTTPAMDHINVMRIISATALECVSFIDKSTSGTGCRRKEKRPLRCNGLESERKR